MSWTERAQFAGADCAGSRSCTVSRAFAIARGASRTIDVRHLPPPLPAIRILEALRELSPGQRLLVRHARRPTNLYPKLDALGCSHETIVRAPGAVEIWISRPASDRPEPLGECL